RQRRSRAIEREVAEPDRAEEVEPAADLLLHLGRDLARRALEREPGEERARLVDGVGRHLHDRASAHAHRRALAAQPRATARRTRGVAEELRIPALRALRRGLPEAALEPRQEALPGLAEPAAPRAALPLHRERSVAGAVQEHLALVAGQLCE